MPYINMKSYPEIKFGMKRYHEIDGIRGWAALAVVLSHLCFGVFGNLFPFYNNLIFRVFFDGYLAVFIFFILSGDALSTAITSSHNGNALAKLVLKRYFRLAGPILLASLLVFLLMRLDLTFNREAGSILQINDWLGSFLNFEPNLIDAIKFGGRFAFVDVSISPSYDPFLWPMKTEMIASFALFLYLAISDKFKYPLVTLLILVIFLSAIRSFYGLFCIGMVLSHIRRSGFFNLAWASRKIQICVLAGTVLLLTTSFLVPATNGQKPFQAVVLQASLIVFLIYSRKQYINFCSNRLSRYLGKISFSLYITHFAVIVSYTSYLAVYFHAKFEMTFQISLLIVISSFFFTILVADIFSRLEQIYLRLLDSVASKLLRLN